MRRAREASGFFVAGVILVFVAAVALVLHVVVLVVVIVEEVGSLIWSWGLGFNTIFSQGGGNLHPVVFCVSFSGVNLLPMDTERGSQGNAML